MERSNCPHHPKFWVIGKFTETFYVKTFYQKMEKFDAKTPYFGKFMAKK